MQLNTLHDVLLDQLSDLYSAENQLVVAAPRMVDAAHAERLHDALEHHLVQTQRHVHRLEQAMTAISYNAPLEVCPGMHGLIAEAEDMIESAGEPAALDAALIGAAQRVEHYEIAAYGTARALARELGYGGVEALLAETLAEEGNADRTLTKLALGGFVSSGINEAAVATR